MAGEGTEQGFQAEGGRLKGVAGQSLLGETERGRRSRTSRDSEQVGAGLPGGIWT